MTGAARTPQVRWVVRAAFGDGFHVVDFDCLDGAAGSSDHALVAIPLEDLCAAASPCTCAGTAG
jgi:hypothetical protein